MASVNRRCKFVDIFLRISLQNKAKNQHRIQSDFIRIIEYFELAVGTHVRCE